MKEALTTTIGLDHWAERTDWFFGFLAVALVAYAAWKLFGPDRNDRRLGLIAFAGAALVYALRFTGTLGFVPGVLTASPLAVAGLVTAWSRPALRRPVAIALLALPLVWFFQYSGGANPQWGGRYVLLSGTLLVTVAAVTLATTVGWGRLLIVGLAVAVTAGGVGWLAERSHGVADAMEHLVARHDQVVISEEAHLLREGGAFYTPQRRWLTAVNPERALPAPRRSPRGGCDTSSPSWASRTHRGRRRSTISAAARTRRSTSCPVFRSGSRRTDWGRLHDGPRSRRPFDRSDRPRRRADRLCRSRRRRRRRRRRPRVLRSGWLTTGDEALTLEAKARGTSRRQARRRRVVVHGGARARARASTCVRGARVGVPTWTFVATALPAVHLGATPVLLDVDPDTLNLAPESLAAAVALRPRCGRSRALRRGTGRTGRPRPLRRSRRPGDRGCRARVGSA